MVSPDTSSMLRLTGFPCTEEDTTLLSFPGQSNMLLAGWVRNNSNYESLEGSEKKYQRHLITTTNLQVLIYSNA
jgi:hypothetical protein